MKTIHNLSKIALALGICLTAITRVLGVEAAAVNSTPESLGYYVEAGRSNRISKVIADTPTYVQVLFTTEEGGMAGRRIPRNELPPELAAKYPFEAEKAAAYQARLAALAAQQLAAQQEAARCRALAIDAEIERLVNADVRLQSEVNLLERAPAGNGRKVRMLHLIDQQHDLREQITRLRQQKVVAR